MQQKEAPCAEPELHSAEIIELARQEIATLQFELDLVRNQTRRLKSRVQAMQANYDAAAAQIKMLKEASEASRLFVWTRKIARRLHALRGRGAYIDPFAHLRVPPAQQIGPVLEVPEPTSATLRALDIPPSVVEPARDWDNAQFKSFYYYNELERILKRPQSKGRPIFIQSPIIDWFVPLFQRPQHMALAMAKEGYLVFYMTANTRGDKAVGFHEVEENVFLTSQPVHLLVQDALISFYSTVATLALWQGDVMERVKRLGSLVLYEYIDHIDPEISFGTTDALARQFALVGDSTVDIALASAKALEAELMAKLSEAPVIYVPNGVEVGHYDRHLSNGRLVAPRELRPAIEAGRPIVGYFGALAPWLWYPTINQLAKARPDLSFVLIGPDYLGGSASIEPADNLYAIGPVDYSILPYYAQHFDVALIPFKPGEIARTTSPLKLFEYFALGAPTVVTRGMAECEQFDVVRTASGVQEYSDAIDAALLDACDPGFRSRLARLADENSWASRAAVLAMGHREIIGASHE